ncbi:uncharacterized protein Tco025E_07583, partial [Trypanosoma conorhini]
WRRPGGGGGDGDGGVATRVPRSREGGPLLMHRRHLRRGVVRPFSASHVSQQRPLHAEPGRTSMQDHLAALVLECDRNASRPFNGCIRAAALTAVGAALWALTFGWNVSKPVMDAYARTQTKGSWEQEDEEE